VAMVQELVSCPASADKLQVLIVTRTRPGPQAN
jgi:hypothetical protein